MSQSSLSERLGRTQRRLVEGDIGSIPERRVQLEAEETPWLLAGRGPRPGTRAPEKDTYPAVGDDLAAGSRPRPANDP